MSPEKPSKSALKREVLALQALGEQLIDLTGEQLAALSLDERLLEAIKEAQGIKSRGALRRQKQLIGKLMRQVDPEPIRRALEAQNSGERMSRELFRQSERWRDRIASEGLAALQEYFEFVGVENRELERQLRAHDAARDDKARRIARRRMFKEVHNDLATRMHEAQG
ncbi:MAG: ribosome biogenesis factor YjgA [Woeseiaceae bacterium]|nr:ribosome biogenesis factor YjgA [Woeseiaceae bacterium]